MIGNHTKRIVVLIVVFIVILLKCGNMDIEAPVVVITSPTPGSIVQGAVNITVKATDNESVEKVVLFIEDSLVATFYAKPYQYMWETVLVSDSTSHDIYSKAYDVVGNEGISPTINVVVDNSSC